ncbi:tryptamine hydroxycinnamoyltransferase 1-like [Typha latifolia]|uniref:tryptamine hydroxycinnamoyltransferase 1-like n=1 Tax=Typha latifolia TaxID=4733 RepID=UPI003C2B2651
MKVQVQRSTVLPHGNPKTSPSELPLSIFDRFASNIHVAVLYAFAPPTPTNEALIDGLSKTLPRFPALTSRLGYTHERRRPCLVIGDDDGGALLVEATVDGNLSDHLPLKPSPELRQLHPPTEGVRCMFQVQINRFNCGGVVIGMTHVHTVADGESMSHFLVTWGETVRGLPIDRPPVHDRSLLTPRSPPWSEFQHRGFEFLPMEPNQNLLRLNQTSVDPSKITSTLLHYSLEFISKLKSSITNKCTTFEALASHIWRKITISRGLKYSQHTTARVSVNGRTKLNIPNEYFGNVVLNACPEANVKLLVEGGLPAAARVIHDGVSKIDARYFRSFVDFGEIYGDEELVPVYALEGNVLCPDVEIDSWLRFRYHEVDFGGGLGMCGLLLTWVPLDGLVVFLPVLGDNGGVNVFVSLLERHSSILNQISHSLD